MFNNNIWSLSFLKFIRKNYYCFFLLCLFVCDSSIRHLGIIGKVFLYLAVVVVVVGSPFDIIIIIIIIIFIDKSFGIYIGYQKKNRCLKMKLNSGCVCVFFLNLKQKLLKKKLKIKKKLFCCFSNNLCVSEPQNKTEKQKKNGQKFASLP